jgi:hypothetical protein
VHNYLETHYKTTSLLIGYSLEDPAVIVVVSKLKNIKAVATISALSTLGHVTHLFSHEPKDISKKGTIEINIGGRSFKINEDFVADFSKTDFLKIIKELRKPILIMHAPFDKIVGNENAHRPKSFRSFNDADHLLTKSLDSICVDNIIETWVKRYFEPEENNMISSEDEQLVAHLNILENNFTTSIKKRNILLLQMNLKILVVPILAAYTTMTLKLYAELKNEIYKKSLCILPTLKSIVTI